MVRPTPIQGWAIKSTTYQAIAARKAPQVYPPGNQPNRSGRKTKHPRRYNRYKNTISICLITRNNALHHRFTALVRLSHNNSKKTSKKYRIYVFGILDLVQRHLVRLNSTKSQQTCS